MKNRLTGVIEDIVWTWFEWIDYWLVIGEINFWLGVRPEQCF